MDVRERMRKDWDDRARRNAFHYIASWKTEWDVHEFLQSGEEDYLTLVEPILKRCGLAGVSGQVLELGCGTGRMTGSFARRNVGVIAADLSAEMLRRAVQIHRSSSNILWLQVSGSNLACLKSGTLGLVFSYLVLQHLPSEELVGGYVDEMLRVLQPGGVFLFQFNGSSSPTMNWKGRIAWGFLDALWSSRLVPLARAAGRIMGLDASAVGKTWRGPAVDAGKIVSMVQSRGGDVREISGETTPMAWCCGIKVRG